MFMKRMGCPGVTAKELFLGSIVTIHSRQLKLCDYGDIFTKKKYEEDGIQMKTKGKYYVEVNKDRLRQKSTKAKNPIELDLIPLTTTIKKEL